MLKGYTRQLGEAYGGGGKLQSGCARVRAPVRACMRACVCRSECALSIIVKEGTLYSRPETDFFKRCVDTCVLQQCWRRICQRGSSACTPFAPFLSSGILVRRKEASFAANTFFTYLWNQVLLQGKIGQIMSFWERHTFRCHHSVQPCFSCTISSLSQAEA